jgi:arginyl-tRNA synthetase
MQRFALLAAQALNQVLETPIQATELETPPDPKLGDLAFPCFKLAKQLRKGPPQIAAQLVSEIQAKGQLPKGLSISTAGPYVNFTVDPELLFKALITDIVAKDAAGDPYGTYGKILVAKADAKTWVLEFSSPNVAKPLNIYHLRPTALGAALDRVGRFRGLNVVSINHLGDWGKQYGMLTVAFQRFDKKIDSKLTMPELVDLYVKINQMGETDPSIADEARAAFVKLEQGDPEIMALWKKCVDISIEEFNRQYKRLNVRFDHIWGESFYKSQLFPLIEDLKRRGLLIESEGAWIVPVTNREGKELPPCIVQKSDGATIYATRDIAAAIYRQKEFNFDRMTYIVGGEQRLHFEQVFAVLRKMELPWADKLEHIPTGLYRFGNAKMSTRKGNFTTLDGVLEAAKERVENLMKERAEAAAAFAATKNENATAEISASTPGTAPETSPASTTLPASSLASLSEAQLAEIAEAVAIGAVVFHDLATDPARDVDFDLEKVVDFEGETGPYLQYAHTRCLSILRKARETGKAPATDDLVISNKILGRLGKPEELALVKTLGQLPTHLERTLTYAKASQLANYLIDVAKVFGGFYRECKVLDDSDLELTQARLLLVESTRLILARGLSLLGIPLPERM